MTNDARVQTLTISLARSDAGAHLVNSSPRVTHYHIRINESTEADLFVQAPKERFPDWIELFDGYVEPQIFGKNSSTSAVLVVTVRQRRFAITFGMGRFLLDMDSFEDRFGLKVALNCIGENTVRSIDKHSLDQLLRHTREQASRDATTGEFGFDIEQDLLRAVLGTPTDLAYGQRILGADSLHMTVPLHLSGLPELLDKLCDKFLDTSYRTKFPWVDQISELSDSRLEQELNNLLVSRIVASQTEHIWMAVPELISWNKVRGFQFPARKTTPERNDIHLDDFLVSVGGAAGVTKEALSRKVVCRDHDGRKTHQWSAFKCTYAELDHKGESFLLSGGKWYRVERDFVKETNAAYARIPNCEEEFPEFQDDSEGAYLKRVAATNTRRFALMDQKKISYGGGHSQVEFCDLLTSDRDIFHVKRYGQSSALSHLFAQGLISGELFQSDEKFRRDVNRKLPLTHRLEDPNDRPKQNRFRVVFAIISDRPGPLHLPFFSRLNLKHAARRLGAYGFRVAKAKISVEEAFSKVAKFRQRAKG